MRRARRWTLVLVLLVACGAEVRFDPSPSCSFRADRAEVPPDAGGPEPHDPLVLALGQRHACATRTNGTVLCWGANDLGQLGVDVSPAEGFVVHTLPSAARNVVAGGAHTCAWTRDRRVFCWGDGRVGQIGSEAAGSSAPTVVPGAEGTYRARAGLLHTCALRRAARGEVVECWGDNRFGQLGRDAGAFDPEPAEVPLDGEVRIAAAGAFHTCALVQDPSVDREILMGTVWCWGRDEDGELGDGEPGGSRTEPRPVPLPGNASGLVAGAHHTCANVDTDVLCWGKNTSGELGVGTFSDNEPPTPVVEEAREGFRALGGAVPIGADPVTGELSVASGEGHSCRYRFDRSRIRCWGANDEGQLGDGTRTARAEPLDVERGSDEPTEPGRIETDVDTLALGGPFGCAIDTRNDVWCWGSNDHGIMLRDGEDALAPERLLLPEQEP